MTSHSSKRPAVSSPGQRLLASLKAEADAAAEDRPHPAALALARQPRLATRNRRMVEFLRIDRGRQA
jgi:hypothetical protein